MDRESAGMIGVKLGAGREADVHAWGDDAVVKLYRPGFGGHRAEAVALANLNGHGVAPKLIDTVDCDGRTGLVLERLGGSDMLSLLQRQPWRVLGLARALAGTHLTVHQVHAPADLPELRQVVAARIHDAVLPPRLRAYVLRTLDELPDGDHLCHGDYHPGNVLVDADRVAVIDWPNAARGVPDADHARTILLLRWADPLPDTPLVSRALITVGRSVFAHGYSRAYRAGSPRPLPQVGLWLLVHAAARLAEGIEVEHATLTGFLDRSSQKAAR
jgi:serine/threonine protein kinase